MKRILNFLLVVITMILTLSCNKVKSILDYETETSYNISIPVSCTEGDHFSEDFEISLDDVSELEEYYYLLKEVSVKDMEIRVSSFKGDDFTGNLKITVEGQELVTLNNFSPKKMYDNGDRFDINKLSPKQSTALMMGTKLLSDKEVEGDFFVESNDGKVTTDFTIMCTFKFKVVANPLN